MGYMWAGRFKGEVDGGVMDFSASLDTDKRLALYDVRGSIAHAKMLAKCGIISPAAGKKIVSGLEKIADELKNNRFSFGKTDEDIHTAIERRLTQLVGKDGERLHTARSRNDQIVLDERLFLKDAISELTGGITSLQKVMVLKADETFPAVMPAYTHLQQSQPVLLSHYFLAYVEMLERDEQRLADAYKRVDVLPAGVCACCGTSLKIDREYLAGLLGFSTVSRNSMDTVASRDFLIEPAGACTMLMLNLSRFCEDLIIWSTTEFGFLELPDRYCTGSSIMPQKKNPDVLELVRGKAAVSVGMLTGLMALMKGLPLSYNRDLQEDKRMAFAVFEDAVSSIRILSGLVSESHFNLEKMGKALSDFTLATDIAEYLVMKNVPFRESHRICGAIVRYCMKNDRNLGSLSVTEWKKFSSAFSEDVRKVLSFEGSVNSRKSRGGTAPLIVKKEIARWKKALK